MRVGVDLRPLRQPLTGIGNYAYHLLEALVHEPGSPDIWGFGRLTWTSVGRSYFEPPVHPSESAPATRSTRRTHALHSRPVRAVHNLIQRVVFERGIEQRKLSLFHALAYVPPGSTPVPVIPVVYDLSVIRYPDLHPAARVRSLAGLGQLLRASPVIHTISQFSAREITEVFGCDPARIAVIYPGVKPIFMTEPTQRQTTLDRYGLKAGEFFLVVSTLEPRKNLRTLVSAYLQLSQAQRERFPLCVVGAEGWNSIDLPSGNNALQSEGSLRFLGFVPDTHLRTLYASARIMLYPSLYEGFGMPIIEALACGAPVVCSNAASMPEAGGSVARTVPALEVEAWTNELRRAMDDTAIDQHDLRRSHALRFTWQAAAALVMKLYLRL